MSAVLTASHGQNCPEAVESRSKALYGLTDPLLTALTRHHENTYRAHIAL